MRLYDRVQELLEAGDMQQLKDLLAGIDMDGLRSLVESLAPDQRILVLRLLTKDRALAFFEQPDVEQRQHPITSFGQGEAASIFAALAPHDRARLLDEVPAAVAKRLVEALPPSERAQVNLLTGYEPESAGRIMTPKLVRLSDEMTPVEALDKVRQVGRERQAEAIHALYVTGPERRLRGGFALQDLVLANPDETMSDLMDPAVIWTTTDTDQEEAARLLQHHDLLSLPVVDQGSRLVGVITIDDAMEIMEEEVTEDFFEKAALSPLAGGRCPR